MGLYRVGARVTYSEEIFKEFDTDEQAVAYVNRKEGYLEDDILMVAHLAGGNVHPQAVLRENKSIAEGWELI